MMANDAGGDRRVVILFRQDRCIHCGETIMPGTIKGPVEATAYAAEKERAEAVLKRLGMEPWHSASVHFYFWMVPFFEAIADRLDRQEKRLDDIVERLLGSLDTREGKR